MGAERSEMENGRWGGLRGLTRRWWKAGRRRGGVAEPEPGVAGAGFGGPYGVLHSSKQLSVLQASTSRTAVMDAWSVTGNVQSVKHC